VKGIIVNLIPWRYIFHGIFLINGHITFNDNK